MNRINAMHTKMFLIAVLSLMVVAVTALPAAATWDDWNCNVKCYWGALDGSPRDDTCFFGVRPGATDDYEFLDCMKGEAMFPGYVSARFYRPLWDRSWILCDMRSPIPEGTSKVWGGPLLPPPCPGMWEVETDFDNGWSGVFDDCGFFIEYPIAASIYITWEFGACEAPALEPPSDYVFTIQYLGGINPKPEGTKLPDATVPAIDQTWDMKTTPYIVVPLWNNDFIAPTPDCTGWAAPDVAWFLFIVHNPDTKPACIIDVDPTLPQSAPATFTFTATGCCDEPYTFDWDFADGKPCDPITNPCTGNPIDHTYDTAGEYVVTCTVTDADGDTGTCKAAVTVLGPPECCFTYEQPGLLTNPSDTEVYFTDCSTAQPPHTIVAWEWSFCDGGTSTEQNPRHVYPRGGCFEVTLTVTDSNGVLSSCSQCVAVRTETEVPLCHAGWHMIAQPHAGDHPLADITVRDDRKEPDPPRLFCDAVGSWVMNPLFYYNTEAMRYELCGCEGEPPPSQDHTLRMGWGYWFYTFEDYLTLVFP